MRKETLTWGLTSRGERSEQTHVPVGNPITPKGLYRSSTRALGLEFVGGARNCFFEDGKVIKRPGSIVFGATLTLPPLAFGTGFFQSAGVANPERLALCCYELGGINSCKLAFWDWGIAAPAWGESATDANVASSVVWPPSIFDFHGTTIFASGYSNPVHWNRAAGPTIIHADAPYTHLYLTLNNYLLCVGGSSAKGGYNHAQWMARVQWADVGTYDTNWLANYFDIWDGGGWPIFWDVISEEIWLVRTNAISRIFFVGGDDEWSYETPIKFGGVFANAACTTHQGIFFLGADYNVYQYQGGTNLSCIGDPIVTGLRTNLNKTYNYLISFRFDRARNLVYVFYPDGTDTIPANYFVYDLYRGVWSEGDYHAAGYAYGNDFRNGQWGQFIYGTSTAKKTFVTGVDGNDAPWDGAVGSSIAFVLDIGPWKAFGPGTNWSAVEVDVQSTRTDETCGLGMYSSADGVTWGAACLYAVHSATANAKVTRLTFYPNLQSQYLFLRFAIGTNTGFPEISNILPFASKDDITQ